MKLDGAVETGWMRHGHFRRALDQFEGMSPDDAMTQSSHDLKLNWQHYRRQVTERPGMTSRELTEETRVSTSTHVGHGLTTEEAFSALEAELRTAPRHLEADFQPGRRTA